MVYYFKKNTFGEGKVQFTGLAPALYLTLTEKSETKDQTTRFEGFITFIPADDTEGGHNYDVTAYPKCEAFDIGRSEVTYKIAKQWSDNGYADKRPSEVDIDILKDGAVFRSEKLSADNNWSYIWTCSDDGSDWQAVKRNVPEKYSVLIKKEKTCKETIF